MDGNLGKSQLEDRITVTICDTSARVLKSDKKLAPGCEKMSGGDHDKDTSATRNVLRRLPVTSDTVVTTG